MRENEFEKRVQEKMGDFKLRPSEEVWIEVERRIRKEKKRRFIFWWPLLFLLTGGGITAGILFTNKKEKTGNITVNSPTGNKFPASSVKTGISKPSQVVTCMDTQTIPGNRNGKAIINENNEIKISSGKKVQKHLPVNKLAGIELAVIKKTEVNNPVVIERNKVIAEKQNRNQHNPQVVSVAVPTKPAVDWADSAKAGDFAVGQNKDLQQKKQQEQEQAQAQLTTDTIQKLKETEPKNKKSKKWDWGIELSGGGSSIINGLSFFEKSSQPNSVPGVFGSTGLADYRSVSTIRPSASFGAGLFIRQPVSKKLDMNFSLSYSYLSTRINVGNRVDSAGIINNIYSPGLTVNNYYRPGTTVAYSNRYHFLSLAMDFSWRIVNGKTLKVYWENGLSYSRFLSSSMLHYDGRLARYYKDNHLLTKNHLFFSTGLSIPVGKRIVVNPFSSYSFTPVLKNSGTTRTRFISYGIRLRFLLNKK